MVGAVFTEDHVVEGGRDQPGSWNRDVCFAATAAADADVLDQNTVGFTLIRAPLLLLMDPPRQDMAFDQVCFLYFQVQPQLLLQDPQLCFC